MADVVRLVCITTSGKIFQVALNIPNLIYCTSVSGMSEQAREIANAQQFSPTLVLPTVPEQPDLNEVPCYS